MLYATSQDVKKQGRADTTKIEVTIQLRGELTQIPLDVAGIKTLK
jgi:hypothetical protein